MERSKKLSIIIPAHNEEDYLANCLASLTEQTYEGALDVTVVANACTDNTSTVARSFSPEFEKKGWSITVIDEPTPGKTHALNVGDTYAKSDNRIYLDADIECSKSLLTDLHEALNTDLPRYATGKMEIVPPKSWITKRYKTIWEKLPFMKAKAAGAGLFSVNRSGRARWGEFPDIISDDTFVRLNFEDSERLEVNSSFSWPLVEGFSNLVKVRRRQDKGVEEIDRLYPELSTRNVRDSPNYLSMLARHPVSFFCYCTVRIVANLGQQDNKWTRGR